MLNEQAIVRRLNMLLIFMALGALADMAQAFLTYVFRR